MLPLSNYEIKNITPDFTAAEIRDYKKILRWGIPKSEKYQNENGAYTAFISNPREWIEEYRKTNAEAEAEKTVQAKDSGELPISDKEYGKLIKNLDELIKPIHKKQAEPELVAAGQMVLTDAGEVEEYHQSGGDGFVRSTGQPTPQEVAQAKLDEILETADDGDVAEVFDPQRYLLSKEEFAAQSAQFAAEAKEPTPPKPARHNFKNNEERKAFINNPANYPVLVLRNEELDLTVRRCDLANGAKIYRTEYKEYLDYQKETFDFESLCLVDVREEAENTGSYAAGTFSPKTYTIDGTSLTYIVDYMTKFKNEI